MLELERTQLLLIEEDCLLSLLFVIFECFKDLFVLLVRIIITNLSKPQPLKTKIYILNCIVGSKILRCD